MRSLALALVTLALAACDSGSVPPPGQEPLRPSTPQVAENEVVLRGGGLIVGSEAFYYAAGEAEVVAALSAVLGEPESTMLNEECGAGPVSFTAFTEGVTFNFQNGTLVGWTLSQPSAQIRVEGDVQIGTSRSEAEAVDGFADFAESTLGEEFYIGDSIGGFMESDAVALLYAGTQCFFR